MNDPKILNCRYCHNYLTLPVKQCKTNTAHNFCAKCTQQMDSCVICDGDICKTDNSTIETIIRNQKFSCRFAESGCSQQFFLCEKSAHELECVHRRYKCELTKFRHPSCDWEGGYADIKEHFRQHHHTQFLENRAVVRVDVTRPYHYLQLVEKHNEYFWFKLQVNCRKQKLYMAFQLIGSKKQASNYSYEIEIQCIQDAFNSTKFVKRCFSDTDNILDIFNAERCGVLTLETAQNLIVRGYLNFNYTINKNEGEESKMNNSQTCLAVLEPDAKSNPGKNRRRKGKKKNPTKQVQNDLNDWVKVDAKLCEDSSSCSLQGKTLNTERIQSAFSNITSNSVYNELNKFLQSTDFKNVLKPKVFDNESTMSSVEKVINSSNNPGATSISATNPNKSDYIFANNSLSKMEKVTHNTLVASPTSATNSNKSDCIFANNLLPKMEKVTHDTPVATKPTETVANPKVNNNSTIKNNSPDSSTRSQISNYPKPASYNYSSSKTRTFQSSVYSRHLDSNLNLHESKVQKSTETVDHPFSKPTPSTLRNLPSSSHSIPNIPKSADQNNSRHLPSNFARSNLNASNASRKSQAPPPPPHYTPQRVITTPSYRPSTQAPFEEHCRKEKCIIA